MPLAVEMPAPDSSTTERQAPERMKEATPSKSKEGKDVGVVPGSPKTSRTKPGPGSKLLCVARSSSSSPSPADAPPSSGAAPPPAVFHGTCSWMTMVNFRPSSRSSRMAWICALICGWSRIQGGTPVSRLSAASANRSLTLHRRSRKRSCPAISHPQGSGEASSANSGMLIVASLVFTKRRCKTSRRPSNLRIRRRGLGRGFGAAGGGGNGEEAGAGEGRRST
mmetsp:Transcript_19581/g.54780  ORF Transcript_19581/g.54780 Transcript_19581/m.54780 type:complete len:223 (+) Transcript_19581:480-1148(+)